MHTLFSLASVGFACAGLAHAGSIQFETLSAYVHGNGTLVGYSEPIEISSIAGFLHDSEGLRATLDSSSPTYFSTLNVDNLGAFGWTFTNSTAATLQSVRFFGFLDADIGRSQNTFFNEYGNFVAFSVPPGAPPQAVSAIWWEIDEPGYLFGDVIANLSNGVLDGNNAVHSAVPDDVSLALGFLVGNLLPGQKLTATFAISTNPIGGLQQVDPDSNFTFYWNGHLVVEDESVEPVPEPGSLLLLATGLLGVFAFNRRRANQPISNKVVAKR